MPSLKNKYIIRIIWKQECTEYLRDSTASILVVSFLNINCPVNIQYALASIYTCS